MRIVTAIALSVTAGTAAAAVNASLFAGGDAGFNALTANGVLEQAVVESRIGNAQSEAGIWEVGLWRFGAVGTPIDSAGRSISPSDSNEFTLSYDGATTLSFSIGGATVASSEIGGTFTDIFIRVRSAGDNSLSSIGRLAFDGTLLTPAFGVAATGNGTVNYLRITNGGEAFGAFTLTGLQQLSWTGTRPNNSALAAQFKFTNVVVPAPAAGVTLAVAGIVAGRRRRG